MLRRLLVAASLFCMVFAACGRKAPAPPTSTEVQEFFAALQDGDASIVDRLLRAKPELANAHNSAGESALAVAKRQTESDVADVIRRHGGHE